ncbi:MAG: hypothetical protein FIA97_02605 [Methylococcaceae bacterium]|nr:hypothetical protein [Methylococcaceae bacterium]
MSSAALLLPDPAWRRPESQGPEPHRPRTAASRLWIESVIRAHEGHSYRSAGLIFGFFPDPAAAHTAAATLRTAGMQVSRFGCQLVIAP